MVKEVDPILVLFRECFHCDISVPCNRKHGRWALFHNVVDGTMSDALQLMMCLVAGSPSAFSRGMRLAWLGLWHVDCDPRKFSQRVIMVHLSMMKPQKGT